MKIYTKIVFDMASPELLILGSESYEYSGPLALCEDSASSGQGQGGDSDAQGDTGVGGTGAGTGGNATTDSATADANAAAATAEARAQSDAAAEAAQAASRAASKSMAESRAASMTATFNAVMDNMQDDNGLGFGTDGSTRGDGESSLGGYGSSQFGITDTTLDTTTTESTLKTLTLMEKELTEKINYSYYSYTNLRELDLDLEVNRFSEDDLAMKYHMARLKENFKEMDLENTDDVDTPTEEGFKDLATTAVTHDITAMMDDAEIGSVAEAMSPLNAAAESMSTLATIAKILTIAVTLPTMPVVAIATMIDLALDIAKETTTSLTARADIDSMSAAVAQSRQVGAVLGVLGAIVGPATAIGTTIGLAAKGLSTGMAGVAAHGALGTSHSSLGVGHSVGNGMGDVGIGGGDWLGSGLTGTGAMVPQGQFIAPRAPTINSAPEREEKKTDTTMWANAMPFLQPVASKFAEGIDLEFDDFWEAPTTGGFQQVKLDLFAGWGG